SSEGKPSRRQHPAATRRYDCGAIGRVYESQRLVSESDNFDGAVVRGGSRSIRARPTSWRTAQAAGEDLWPDRSGGSGPGSEPAAGNAAAGPSAGDGISGANA